MFFFLSGFKIIPFPSKTTEQKCRRTSRKVQIISLQNSFLFVNWLTIPEGWSNQDVLSKHYCLKAVYTIKQTTRAAGEKKQSPDSVILQREPTRSIIADLTIELLLCIRIKAIKII